MPDPKVSLFCDSIDHLNRYAGGQGGGTEDVGVREAVDDALEDLAKQCHWVHHQTSYRIVTETPVTNLTATYTHSTKTLTFSAAPPTWLLYARVLLPSVNGNNVLCDVKSYTSGNSCTLDDTLNPGGNLAAGTASAIRRYAYPLPGDFKGIFGIHEETGRLNWRNYTTLAQILRWERWSNDSSHKLGWTIAPDPDRQNGWTLFLSGAPTDDATIDFLYHRYPRDLLWSGYEADAYAGTVTNSGATVELSSATTFAQSMVGSWLRFGTTSNYPESKHGQYRYAEQHRIASVTDNNTLVLSTTPSATHTAVKYRIADPIDIPRHLDLVFKRAMEWQYELRNRTGEGAAGKAFTIYHAELKRALADDNMFIDPERTGDTTDTFFGMYPPEMILAGDPWWWWGRPT